jgi:glycosyltransferase involved in cell wall biosynthesis
MNQSTKVLHQKNTGVCEARNTGLKTAQGDYVFFLDGDDYLTDNASEIFTDVAVGGADIVCFKNLVQVGGYDAQQKLGRTTSIIPKGIYMLGLFLLLMILRHGGFIPWDGDVDVAMSRADYKRLLEIGTEGLPENLFLQTYEIDPAYMMPFAKIRLGKLFSRRRKGV